MERYKNLGGDSNVVAYEIGNDYIKVKFADGCIYLYNYFSTKSQNIEEMKKLARIGEGLNEFINRYVKKQYASKML